MSEGGIVGGMVWVELDPTGAGVGELTTKVGIVSLWSGVLEGEMGVGVDTEEILRL